MKTKPASKMRFTSLKLESWKNFKRVDVPLAERVLEHLINAESDARFRASACDRAGHRVAAWHDGPDPLTPPAGSGFS
jgi:hypothetical protein